MGLGDLCYRSDGYLAYSKLNGSSLIYKGTWGFTLSWSGTFESGRAFNSGSVSHSGSPQSSYSWQCETSESPYIFYVVLFTSERWHQTGQYGFGTYTSEPTAWPTPPDPQIWYAPYCSVLFYRSNWSSYGGGFGVSTFSNYSSGIGGSYTLTDDNTDYSSSIGSVGVSVGWT
jgi:hypothetical protein